MTFSAFLQASVSGQALFAAGGGGTSPLPAPTMTDYKAFRYYRIYFTAGSFDDYKRVYEMLLSETIGGSHKSDGTVTFSSTTGNTVEGAEKAFDGNANTAFVTTSGTVEAFLKVDFGSAVKIREVMLAIQPPAGTSTVRLEGSNDNSTWQMIWDFQKLRADLRRNSNLRRFALRPTIYRMTALTTSDNNGYLTFRELYLVDGFGQRIDPGSGYFVSGFQSDDPASGDYWRNAIDNNTATASIVETSVLHYFTSAVPAAGLAVMANAAGRSLKTWKLDRSDDYGITWTPVIAEKTEAAWTAGELRTSYFANTTSGAGTIIPYPGEVSEFATILSVDEEVNGASNDWQGTTLRNRIPIAALSDKTKKTMRFTLKTAAATTFSAATIGINTGNTGFGVNSALVPITFDGGSATKVVPANTEFVTDPVTVPDFADADALMLSFYTGGTTGGYIRMTTPSGGGAGYANGDRSSDVSGSGWSSALLANAIKKIEATTAQSGGGTTPVPSVPFSSVYAAPTPVSDAAFDNQTARARITASSLSSKPRFLRYKLQAGANGAVISKGSFGLGSGSDFTLVAAPVAITFGGNAGKTAGANEVFYTDPIDTNGMDLTSIGRRLQLSLLFASGGMKVSSDNQKAITGAQSGDQVTTLSGSGFATISGQYSLIQEIEGTTAL